MKIIQKYRLFIAWFISMVAMGGSLYFSEIQLFIPCEWCWYQRILMYPLVVILGMATIKKDERIFCYIRPLVMLGALLACLHYLQQKTHIIGDVCTSAIPCSFEYINWFGFITIPFLSLMAFLLLTILSSLKTGVEDKN